MTLKKRIAAAALAGCLSMTSAVVVPVVANAATTRLNSNTAVMSVYPEVFMVNGAPCEVFNNALLKLLKKDDIDTVTFSDLYSITNLNLSGLGLEGVPRAVEFMHNLKTLNLSKNKLHTATTDEIDAFLKTKAGEDYGTSAMGMINDLDLSDCISLNTVDISNNYLTSVPSWYVALNISTKKISNNLINADDQRSIKLLTDTYYFMVGDPLNENEFKDKVLSSLRLSDGTTLPKFMFDPRLPTYNVPADVSDPAVNTNVEVEVKLTPYITNGIVSKPSTSIVTGTVKLISSSSSNAHTMASFKVYLLDGSDPSTLKIRLESLVGECAALVKADYTTSSWTAFEAALKTAQALLSYSSADTDMLQTALDNLAARKAELVNGVSSTTKKTLTDLLAIAKNFKEEDYTAESWIPFAKAVEMLTNAANNVDASVIEANAAIKAYQEAQAGLKPTNLVDPGKATKADFESIYGENKTLSYKGVTRDNYSYIWYFNGLDVKTPADMNLSIAYESSNEEAIRFEVGSTSDYHIISFAEKGIFPGAATVRLDVSKTYRNGTYRLYKWNTAAKAGEFVQEVSVVDGVTEFTVSSGGDYYISSVLQNFQMISSSFNIDNANLTIVSRFKQKYTIADFRNAIDNGHAVEILNADGSAVAETQYIATGMTARAANSDVYYTLVVPGDVDGDGNVTALDAVCILKAIIGEISLDTYAKKLAADLNGDKWVRADDAVCILKYVIGID